MITLPASIANAESISSVPSESSSVFSNVSRPRAYVGGSSGYSSDLSAFDPMNKAIDWGLNYGTGLVNSMGEAALSDLMDGGRARLNFRFDRNGYFSGEGDTLLPFYDGKYTTIYTQLGARSMHDSSDTRWIGNFGLGQRWFPLAQGNDLKSIDYNAGVLMLGYNAFFDYDFTRNHQRGGLGAEAWYDWLRLSLNYYFPLSGWKDSKDFDRRFVKERPAKGWDARTKAYLPFYRQIALTGAYSQWSGDHVGMFGASKLEKDPKVWSYGLEYTPVPLVTGFINQKSTERGRTATEFGLNFTYYFQMPWEDQITPTKVTELRTVGGSRHEFVDRENKIILEYQAKSSYRIEYLGMLGSNTFRFRIMNGFDEFVSGKVVHISSNNNITLSRAATPRSFFARTGDFLIDLISIKAAYAATSSLTKTTDSRGEFTVTVDSPITTNITLTVQAGDSTESVTVNVVGKMIFSIDTASPLPTAVVGVDYNQSLLTSGGTAPYTFTVTSGSLPVGLNLSGSVISGTPTTVGTSTFTIAATDSLGATAKKEFSLRVSTTPKYSIAFDNSGSYNVSFSGSGSANKASQSVIVTVLNTTDKNTPVSGASVSFNAKMSTTNPVVISSRKDKFYGLKVDSTDGGDTIAIPAYTTDANGQITLNLEDIVGERILTLTASVTPPGGSSISTTASVRFGNGPLSKLRFPVGLDNTGRAGWANRSPISAATRLPAANLCGAYPADFQNWIGGNYSAQTNLPARDELVAVATIEGLASAAGWSQYYGFAWTGELVHVSSAYIVNLENGDVGNLTSSDPSSLGLIGNVTVVCRR